MSSENLICLQNFTLLTLIFCSQIAVVLVALGVFAAGLYGTINMEQFFDAKWFIPSDSYLSDYFEKSEEYFPEGGLDVAVYTGNTINHPKIQ